MKTLIKTTFLLLLLIPIGSCSNDKKQDTLSVTDNNTTSTSENIISTETNADIHQFDTLTFRWINDMCEITGYYLPDKWTEEELQNTLNLWNKLDQAFIGSFSVFYPHNISEIDIQGLTKEYNELVSYMDNCNVVNLPFWKEWVKSEKKNIKMRYELTKMRGEAFSDPSVLLNNKYIDKNSDCQKYAIALNSDETTLYEAWKTWIHESKKNNGDPEGYVQRFNNKFNSPDKLAYAYIDLITFAWWNCVNKHIQYPDNEILSKEFEKLFIKTEYDCEEP